MSLLQIPHRTYAVIALTLFGLGVSFLLPQFQALLWIAALLGSLDTFWSSAWSLLKRQITIDTFNVLALAVSFATGNIRSAAFIVLMLAFAELLEWRTESHAKDATQELLKLKPHKAFVEFDGAWQEIPVDEVKEGEVLLVKPGARIPVDGIVVFGKASVNESSVSGESRLIEKVVGEKVFAGTLNESGVIKIKATNVGKNSTIERMVSLMKAAARNKSRSEKLADTFAKLFLPAVISLGIGTFLVTRNPSMTAALFLIACADDIAVAIPLAMTAALGQAAKRGVLIKGGEYLSSLGKIKTLVLDKTGTLTYGTLKVSSVVVAPGQDEKKFLLSLAIAEKFSEHPVSHAILHEALKHFANIPDPDEFKVMRGSGVWARLGSDEIVAGNESMFEHMHLELAGNVKMQLKNMREKQRATAFAVFLNKQYGGMVALSDIPRKEAKESLQELRNLGIENIMMLTGDNEQTALHVAKTLGIDEVQSSMSPEQKLAALENLTKRSMVAMVGDGINDAPVLKRAHVGIAMGSSGTAVAVEAADVVVLPDDLSRIPEMVKLGRKTTQVIWGDMVIWALSNAIGFFLVWTGLAGPALAAFYNFATDFLPLINSARLFKK